MSFTLCPLETERLLIRRFTAGDWCDLHEYLSQEEVVRYEPYNTFTEEESKREAASRAADKAFRAVCIKAGGKLIGNLYLGESPYETLELGYVFNKNFQGRGYAAEAARCLLGNAFDQGARRIVALCNPLNEASWRLLERLGFRREGHLRQNIYFKKDGEGRPLWADTYEYAMMAGDWV